MAADTSKETKSESMSEEMVALANKVIVQNMEQLRTSRSFKRTRLAQIVENENLYLGLVEKQLRNPYNECFPFMAGFIDYYKARIEDDSALTFTHQAEADLKRALKVQGMYDRVSNSQDIDDSWAIKHRYAKTNALFSGVGTYKYFAESDPEYHSVLRTISHYDFHNEPRGGGMIDNHLFCGEDNIFKDLESLEDNDCYYQPNVAKIAQAYKDYQYKDSWDYEGIRNSRFYALGQQPESNNFVGQSTVKLVDWYSTYGGERYYMLFNEQTATWVRFCKLTDLFPDNLWPYVCWHTNEDPDVFWSKAPADDARPLAKIINTFLNQELYNRQKQNYGQKHYDVDMYPNVAALADWRPDGLVPVKRKAGEPISSGIYTATVGNLSGTLDMVGWIRDFSGRDLGATSSTQGEAPASKQATVFVGEVEQVDKLIGIKNKSYYDALSRLGLRFKQGLENNLTTEVAIKVMGGRGIEWTKLSPEDLKELENDLTIIPSGGTSEAQLKRAQDSEKAGVLLNLQTVNPQWKDAEMLRLKGYTEDQIKEAFSTDDMAARELLSEAAMAEKEIVEGESPALNRGATSAFMQHIVDFATNTENLSDEQHAKLIKYAMDHTQIALENMNRNIKEMLAARAKASLSTPVPSVQAPTPEPGAIVPPYGADGGTQRNINPTKIPVVG